MASCRLLKNSLLYSLRKLSVDCALLWSVLMIVGGFGRCFLGIVPRVWS